jgi:hypothetical protein
MIPRVFARIAAGSPKMSAMNVLRSVVVRFAASVVVVLALLVATPRAVHAKTIQLSSFPVRIHYDEGDERVARKIGEICEEDLSRLASQLGLAEIAPFEVEVTDRISRYRDHFGADLPTWGVAFAMMYEQRMVVDVARATRAWNSLETVIPHELSHLLVAQRIGRVTLPIWFLEGLAQWQADEWSLVDGWQLMNAVWSGKAPKLWQLQNRYPAGEEAARAAYRLSYVAFTDLFKDRSGDLGAFLEEVRRRGGFEEAFVSFFGEYPASFYGRFHNELEAKYHSRLLVFQTGPLFSILAAAFVFLAIRYHLRKKRRLREMSDGADVY